MQPGQECMVVSPPCRHYLRRLLKRVIRSTSASIIDLLEHAPASGANLDSRLHALYPHPHSYCNVVLHIETLVCSHQALYTRYQHPTSSPSALELEKIVNQLMWWLGYEVELEAPSSIRWLKTPTIFIVEDTIEIIKFVSKVVATQQYGFDSALSGELALEMIQESPPDLILLDINLPDMDGYQVYQHLQTSSITQTIPVIFLTGMDRNLELQTHLSDRVGYLHKPFSPDGLLEKMAQYLNPDSFLPNERSKSHDSPFPHRKALRTVDGALQIRRHQARRLSSRVEMVGLEPQREVQDVNLFFRATLEGRYLRVSHAFAHLCGYGSAADMVSQVTNVWNHIYRSEMAQDHWRLCLHYPNQFQSGETRVYTQSGQAIDIWEQVCLVQDEYHHRLFYQGYIKTTMLSALGES